jgi:inner membrane protein
MIILGLIVFISLYILKLPYFIGLIIIFLGVIFYFSEHRSFTHSIFGVMVITSAVSLVVIWAYELVMGITILNNPYLVLAVLIALLSFLFLNRNLLMLFLPLFFISLFAFTNLTVTYLEIVLAVFLGVFSHTVLDSFTPAGIKIFAPLSSKKVYKRFGLISIFFLVLFAICYRLPLLFNLFEQYLSLGILGLYSILKI